MKHSGTSSRRMRANKRKAKRGAKRKRQRARADKG